VNGEGIMTQAKVGKHQAMWELGVNGVGSRGLIFMIISQRGSDEDRRRAANSARLCLLKLNVEDFVQVRWNSDITGPCCPPNMDSRTIPESFVHSFLPLPPLAIMKMERN